MVPLPWRTRRAAPFSWILVATYLTSCSISASAGSQVRGKTLITFDVDGTLIHGSSPSAEISSHAKAFSFAIGKVFSDDENAFCEKFQSPLHAIAPTNYHGSTDGLIALHFAKSALSVAPENALPKLPQVFRTMYDYVAKLSDEDMIRGIEPLPGVIATLQRMASNQLISSQIICGLVTGNVEGIARKKMRACGIYQTGLLSRKSSEQTWEGEDDASFLGGFGSDFCSGDIEDQSRVFKDRAEQICIAFQRARSLLGPEEHIHRVVHVGDAPGDVLAAKWCSENGSFGDGVTVGCVGVATGKFSAEHLRSLAGDRIEGAWEPVVLDKGVADHMFPSACGLVTDQDEECDANM